MNIKTKLIKESESFTCGNSRPFTIQLAELNNGFLRDSDWMPCYYLVTVTKLDESYDDVPTGEILFFDTITKAVEKYSELCRHHEVAEEEVHTPLEL